MILADCRSHVQHDHTRTKYINFVFVGVGMFAGEFRGKELGIFVLDSGGPSHSFGQQIISSDWVEVCQPKILDTLFALFTEHECLRVYSSVHNLLLHQSAEHLDKPFVHLHKFRLGERFGRIFLSSLFTVLL